MTEERFVLAELNKVTWAFPADLVSEIVAVERDKLLNLPFYSRGILGCVHHRGDIITLVSLREVIGIKLEQIRQKIIFIRLSNSPEKLGGIGILVDKILVSKNKQELQRELFLSGNSSLNLFNPEILTEEIWQPVRSLLKSNS
jgi:chemotaxis signal transduction protein